MAMNDDTLYMRHALRLAQRGFGRVWPVTSVGCVLVKEGRIIGAARTADSGRPHAETQALQQADELAKGCTAYVTLEPCAHHGKTPPCAEALINAGIARCVIACTDPDPRVAGKGIAMLQEAGIEVEVGLLEDEATRQHAGFFKRLQKEQPLVSLKIATSLDAKIATKNGDVKWITGQEARMVGHSLRAEHDAILTGIGTVIADDPLLSCRLPGRETHSPIRIILDSNLRISRTSQLLKTAHEIPLWIFTSPAMAADNPKRILEMEKMGATLFFLQKENNGLPLNEVLRTLANQGITRLLVEGGAQISSAFIEQKLVDRLYWFRAPFMIGKDGIDAFHHTQNKTLATIKRYTQTASRQLGEDMLEIFETG